MVYAPYRRLVVLGILTVTLTAAGAADTRGYEATLYPDVGDEKYELTGAYEARFQGQELELLFTYNVDFEDDRFNLTESNAFEAQLRNTSGHVFATTELESFTLTDNQTRFRGNKLTTTTPPRKLDHVWFVANYTATYKDSQVTREATGGFPVEITGLETTMELFETNATNVTRGSHMYVTGQTQNITNASINNRPFDVGMDGTFNGWVDVPADIATGPQELAYTVETDMGQFERTVDVNVLNQLPTVSADYNDQIVAGKDTAVELNTTDERGVANVTVTFQNQSLPVDEGVVTIPTASLSAGTYNFSVQAVDTNDAVTARTYVFEVLTEEQDTGTDGTNGEDTDEEAQGEADGEDGDEKYSENASVLISIVQAIRDAFESLLFG